MSFKARPSLPALALVLVQAAATAGTPHPILQPAEVAAHRARQPERAGQALAFLKTQALGLAPGDAFQQLGLATNTQGQTVVRFAQLHQGYRVFGSALTVRVNPEGTLELLAADTAPALGLSDEPVLTPAEAIQAAHRNIAPVGEYDGDLTTERLVFPTAFAHGFKVTMDEKGSPKLDRDASLIGPRPTSPYVWAYKVNANLRNAQDGYRELHLIVDARTGQVLRKWDDVAGFLRQAPKAPKALDYGAMARLASSQPVVAPKAMPVLKAQATAAPSPATGLIATKGWGHDQYLGLVPLDTVQSPLGTGYDLVDATRSSLPHPRFQTWGNQTWYWDPMPYWGKAPTVGDYQWPYSRSEYFNSFTMDNLGWSAGSLTGAGSTTNVWGDGQNYLSPYNISNGYVTHVPSTISEFHFGDANGQTAAVGAHYASQVTYDMYKNVFGWLGIDGKDSAMIQVVHDNLGGFGNAHFSGGDMMMHYGDGDWSPTNGGAYKSFAQITIAGHEMSHGVMDFNAAVNYWGEGMGLNESNSDIMGVCVEAYNKRGPADPPHVLPEGKAAWVLGAEMSAEGRPFRYMYKPSLDGISVNQWYAGINNLDGHYSSGVANRFFYFLVMGASADATQDTHSPYLPGGMAGIGLDAAARIWFKAMQEHMTPSTNLRGIRAPLLTAATDLYGENSTQYQAVANALAAVNIGAAYGTAGRPLVTFPNNLVDPNSPLGSIGLPTRNYSQAGLQYVYYTVPIVPMGETTRLKAIVSNATDTSVTWTTGWPFLYVPFPYDGIAGSQTPSGPSAANGSFEADGTYRAPFMGPKFCMVQATSKADPLEFGYLPTLAAHLDADGDGESDAVDMGAFALCYGLPYDVSDYVNYGGYTLGTMYYGSYGYIGYTFDDYSLQAFIEAFTNAFAQ